MRDIHGCSQATNPDGPAEYKLLNWTKLKPDHDGVIYWHVANFTEKMDKFKILFAFQTCFTNWQAAIDAIEPVGRVITLKPTDDWHQAQIRLYFLHPGATSQDIIISDGSTVQIKNQWPFDGPQGVLAHRPPNSFDLHFDDGENWSEIHKYEKVGDQYVLFVQLWQVAMHELGHIMDIDHSKDKLAIMYPTYDGEHITIMPDDMAGLSASLSKTKQEVKNLIMPPEEKSTPMLPCDLILTALKYYGIHEVPGPGNESDIISIIKSMFPDAKNDGDVAWCAIFMNFIMKECGIKGTGSALARSFLTWGSPVEWDDRRAGDIAVFWRGTPGGPNGHVSIYINDKDVEGKYLRVLGGNQADAISIALYQKSNLLALRRLNTNTE